MSHNPFDELLNRLDRIEALIERLGTRTEPHPPPVQENSNPLTVEDAAKFLGLTKGTVYGLVHQRAIPFSKRRKRLYFDRNQLRTWISSGGHQTTSQIEIDVRHSRAAIKEIGNQTPPTTP